MILTKGKSTVELCTQSISKELFKKFNLAVLFSCCCPIGKGEQYYIRQGGVIARRVKFPPAKQEHSMWMITIPTLVDSWQPARRL